MSFAFVGVIIFTYLAWGNYYRAVKSDPGVIVSNRDRVYRV